MDKDVCNWCVILMKEGWKTQVFCDVFSFPLESVEGGIINIIQVWCFFEMIFLHFFHNREWKGIPFGIFWKTKLLVAIGG